MKFIEDLSSKQVQDILTCLKEEGFTKIKNQGSYISFSKGYRTYELVSTDINDQEEGLRVDFDYPLFMKKQYEEKTRHTVSLREAVDKTGSVEDGCKRLHWKISKTEHILSKKSSWIADVYTDYIYEVKIGDHVHILVNEVDENMEAGLKVYSGTMDALWRMGTVPVKELFLHSKLISLLKKIG